MFKPFINIKRAAIHSSRMCYSYQRVILVGNVGTDPELVQYTNSIEGVQSKPTYKFSFATNKTYRNVNNETKTVTTWHNIQTSLEIVGQNTKKGDKLLIEGEISNWKTDASHGSKIISNKIVFMSTKKDE